MKGHSIGEIRIGKGSQGVYWNKRINMSFISRHSPVVPFLILILNLISLKGRESESILGVLGAIAQLWMDFGSSHWDSTSQGRQKQPDGAESHAALRGKDGHREKEKPPRQLHALRGTVKTLDRMYFSSLSRGVLTGDGKASFSGVWRVPFSVDSRFESLRELLLLYLDKNAWQHTWHHSFPNPMSCCC